MPDEKKPQQQASENNQRELILQAMLAEYNSLKNELLQKFRHQLQIYYTMFASIGVLLYIFKESQSPDIIMILLPFVSAAFAFRYLWEQYIINNIGDYLRIMEKEKLPEIIGHRDDKSDIYFVGWEHYFEAHWPKDRFFTLDFYKITIFLIFVAPILLSLIYDIIYITKCDINQIITSNNIISYVPISIFAVAALINIFLIVYLLKKLNRTNEKNSKQC